MFCRINFWVINADGRVYPCEILDKPLGALRDYDMNFMKLWNDKLAQQTKNGLKTQNVIVHMNAPGLLIFWVMQNTKRFNFSCVR